MKRRAITALSCSIALAAVAFATGCGGDDNKSNDSASTTTTDTTTTASTADKAITIKMGEYFFDPKDATVSAGKVKITAPNTGKLLHELVLLKTNREPGSFKASGGEVDEKALEDSGIEIPGEIADVDPGKTKSATINLTPGKYAMICNISGHYAAGMYGSVTAK
jgi:uncharacterized cupredoxin-like copper-binding protein